MAEFLPRPSSLSGRGCGQASRQLQNSTLKGNAGGKDVLEAPSWEHYLIQSSVSGGGWGVAMGNDSQQK